MRNIFYHIIRKPLYQGFITLGCIGIGMALAAGFNVTLSGIFGTPHTIGSFDSRGNAGQIIIAGGAEPCDPIAGTGQLCYDSSTQSFSGWVFSETVGWIELGVAGYPVTAIVPTDINSLTPWTLTGYAWSSNAGWITLGGLGDCSYSGVAYVPNSTVSLTGTAWSDNIGYIDFYTGGADFTNKVKVIGSAAGGNAWSVNYNIGNTYDTVKLTPYISQVRKNIAILTRNAGTGVVNKTLSDNNKLGNIRYYRLSGGTLKINTLALSDIDSIIVEGGDIEIESDIDKDVLKSPKSIIAIHNSTGSGGNIFIKNSVKNIYSSIIAEGAIYSGEDITTIYNDTRGKIANLPKNQLYIYGNLISHNTIGGALKDTPTCPYTTTDCTYDLAIRYDLNYFRSYDRDIVHQSESTEYDEYSVIIERDPRVTSSPPPGMKTLK